MGKRFIILMSAFFISLSLAAFGAGTADQALLRDGFVLRGIVGTLTGPDSNDVWFFKFDSDISDDKSLVKAGSSLELLPSAALERMTADVKKPSEASYRLWARVTKYKGRNYLFPSYFLSLGKAGKPQSQTLRAPQKPQQQESRPTEPPSEKVDKSEPVISEPNDILTIPKEILDKLKIKRVMQPEKLLKSPKVIKVAGKDLGPEEKRKAVSKPDKKPGFVRDSILVNRTGFLVKQADGSLVFNLDALGRKIQSSSLRLLPCQALELTEQEQFVEPDLIRFKIAGIVTVYKGRRYLLLQRATRVYSHQNFGR